MTIDDQLKRNLQSIHTFSDIEGHIPNASILLWFPN